MCNLYQLNFTGKCQICTNRQKYVRRKTFHKTYCIKTHFCTKAKNNISINSYFCTMTFLYGVTFSDEQTILLKDTFARKVIFALLTILQGLLFFGKLYFFICFIFLISVILNLYLHSVT